MESDPIRRQLKSFLADLFFVHDVPGQSYTIAPVKIELWSEKWHQVNDIIEKLGGGWVKSTKFSNGHWRIPRCTSLERIRSAFKK
ncbi:MAG: hypothetical protein ABSA92_16625 [Candidatus Bathyarchaeia archaeon]